MNQKLNNQELFNFCEQLGMILHSGISAAEGLQLLYEDSPDEASKKLCEDLIRNLEETGSLSEALTKTERFPDSMIAYMRVGEESGSMDEVLQSLADRYDQEIFISGQIRSAVTYPLVMLGMMIVVIGILLGKVLPVFRQVFRQMGMELTGVAGGMVRAGEVIGRYSVVFLVILILIVVLILFVSFHSRGRNLLNQIVSRIPLVRDIPVTLDYSRLSQAMSLGLRSGLGPESSLQMAQTVVTHPLVLEKLQKSSSLLDEGEMFAPALTKSELFNGMDARLINIAYTTGKMDEVMRNFSARYQDESSAQIEHAVSIIEPSIVVILSVLVGLVLLSVMMPLLGILSEMMI